MYDVIIIGAGPAGLTAGLYSGRYRINALILEKLSPGGQIITSATIDNFPGFPEGTNTQELIDRMRAQVEGVGIRIENAEAQEITQISSGASPAYCVKTPEKSYETRAVIIATGAYPRKLNVVGETRLIGRGVSYCGTCDGPLFKNKAVVVVGGGDRALEDALYLSTYATSVTIVHRRQQLRGSKILEEKARTNKKISFIFDTVIEEIVGEKKVESVRLKNVISGEVNNFYCQGVFIFVGMLPNTEFVKLFLQTDESGFIITDRSFLTTSRPGIFACGDVQKKSLNQVITASADGALAADSAFKFLINQPQ